MNEPKRSDSNGSNSNRSSAKQTHKVSNIQFTDLVYTSSDEIEINKKDLRNHTDKNPNLAARYEKKIPGNKSKRTTKYIKQQDEEMKKIETTDNSIIETTVDDDEVANVARVVAKINGHFAEKIAKISDQVTYIEDKTRNLDVKSNNRKHEKPLTTGKAKVYGTGLSPRKLVINENNMIIYGDEDLKTLEDKMKEDPEEYKDNKETDEDFSNNTTVSFENSSTNMKNPSNSYLQSEHVLKEENLTEENAFSFENGTLKSTEDFQTDKANEKMHVTFEDTLKDESQDDKEISLQDSHDEIEEEHFELESRGNSQRLTNGMKKQIRIQRKNNTAKTERKRLLTRNEDRQSYNLAQILIYSAVVNLIISLAIAFIFQCNQNKLINSKLDKRLEFSEMLNQPMDEHAFLKFYLSKKFIDATFKVFMDSNYPEKGDSRKKENIFKAMKDDLPFEKYEMANEINPYAEFAKMLKKAGKS